MDWRYDGLHACHELVVEDGTVAAKIYESDRAKRAKPFRAKSLISVYFYGERRLGALARRNKEWVTNRRDFPTKADRDTYVVTRKDEIARFVRARES